jgi:hypothetical protein
MGHKLTHTVQQISALFTKEGSQETLRLEIGSRNNDLAHGPITSLNLFKCLRKVVER